MDQSAFVVMMMVMVVIVMVMRVVVVVRVYFGHFESWNAERSLASLSTMRYAAAPTAKICSKDPESGFRMSHEERDYEKQLREHGFRVTWQRIVVLDAVCDVGGHASTAAVVKRVAELDPSIDLSTIYRALDVLTQAQLVVSAEIDGVRVYEIAEPVPHHHLICRQCGAVQPLSHKAVQPLLDHVLREHGFQIESEHLVLSGLCATCQAS